MRHNSFPVSRIKVEKSNVHKLSIELDINTDIYPVEQDGYYKFVLASSVNSDGSEGFDVIKYENSGSAGSGMGALIDLYEYVMHGKVFKYHLDEEKKQM